MRRFFHDGATEKALILLNPHSPNAITSLRHLSPRLHTGSGSGDASKEATYLCDSRHCTLEIAFDFQRRGTLELMPITGSERMSGGTKEERSDARKPTPGTNI
jgi:hypothetical protein